MTTETARDAGITARRVMRATDRVALATAQRDAEGWPYPSLALVALGLDGTPLLLLSTLAEHTRNLLACDRVGVLFETSAGLDEPLASARVSVQGRARRTESPQSRRRYLARHPSAALYAGFADFACYEIVVERAHLVAGFGRVRHLESEQLLVPATAIGTLAEDEAALVAEFNAACDGTGWTVTGIDPDGCDLRRSGVVTRVDFPTQVRCADEARAAFREAARPGCSETA